MQEKLILILSLYKKYQRIFLQTLILKGISVSSAHHQISGIFLFFNPALSGSYKHKKQQTKLINY
ncbi:hypothetical protein TH53_22385 [Pedobacter lusitanus]|uniref:Uncharacterized protein n=1 Tax=Pedobacter lusitanus TaxID=1503925 RepID=A0A0D0F0K3_9SPHI|nr:hypothetical protein TH53_22385 [Pedobacter lusitanus]